MKSNSFRERQLALIENNVNIGKDPLWKEALKIIFGFVVLFISLYIVLGIFVHIYVDKMSVASQNKVESLFVYTNSQFTDSKDSKYSQKLALLNHLKTQIIAQDPSLQGRSALDIHIHKSSSVNAFITPNGDIYFTSQLLEKVDNEQTLAFILAHEIGHYANRHHLKRIGRTLVLVFLQSLFASSLGSDASLSQGIGNFAAISYSKSQEVQADLYASKVCTALFNSNKGGTDFFEFLSKQSHMPEFLSYFSTHPHPKKRIALLKKQQKI